MVRAHATVSASLRSSLKGIHIQSSHAVSDSRMLLKGDTFPFQLITGSMQCSAQTTGLRADPTACNRKSVGDHVIERLLVVEQKPRQLVYEEERCPNAS